MPWCFLVLRLVGWAKDEHECSSLSSDAEIRGDGFHPVPGEWACSLIILNFTSPPLLVSILVRVQLDKKQDIKYCDRKKKYGELVLENWKTIKDQWGEIRDRNCRKRLPPLGPGIKEVGEVNRTLKLGSWGAAELEPRTWRGELPGWWWYRWESAMRPALGVYKQRWNLNQLLL